MIPFGGSRPSGEDSIVIVADVSRPPPSKVLFVTLRVVASEQLDGLTLELTSPLGTRVTLLQGVTGDSNIDITFQDKQATTLVSPVTFPVFAAPVDPLALFVGEPVTGKWLLSVSQSKANVTVGMADECGSCIGSRHITGLVDAVLTFGIEIRGTPTNGDRGAEPLMDFTSSCEATILPTASDGFVWSSTVGGYAFFTRRLV